MKKRIIIQIALALGLLAVSAHSANAESVDHKKWNNSGNYSENNVTVNGEVVTNSESELNSSRETDSGHQESYGPEYPGWPGDGGFHADQSTGTDTNTVLTYHACKNVVVKIGRFNQRVTMRVCRHGQNSRYHSVGQSSSVNE